MPAATPRTLAAWALLGYVALYEFFTFFGWLIADANFTQKSASAGFLRLLEMAMPLLAVLLAAYVTPELARARQIAAIAVAAYAFALFFGALTFLIGLGAAFDNVNTFERFFNGLQYLVLGLATIGLVAVAGYVTYRTYISLGGRRLVTRTTT